MCFLSISCYFSSSALVSLVSMDDGKHIYVSELQLSPRFPILCQDRLQYSHENIAIIIRILHYSRENIAMSLVFLVRSHFLTQIAYSHENIAIFGHKFSETGSSCKDPSKSTPLATQMSSSRPQVGFLGPSTDHIGRQKSFKIEPWTCYPTGSNPRRPQDGPKGGPRAPELVANSFR